MLKDLMPEEPALGVNPASSGNGLLPTRPLFCVSKKENEGKIRPPRPQFDFP